MLYRNTRNKSDSNKPHRDENMISEHLITSTNPAMSTTTSALPTVKNPWAHFGTTSSIDCFNEKASHRDPDPEFEEIAIKPNTGMNTNINMNTRDGNDGGNNDFLESIISVIRRCATFISTMVNETGTLLYKAQLATFTLFNHVFSLVGKIYIETINFLALLFTFVKCTVAKYGELFMFISAVAITVMVVGYVTSTCWVHAYKVGYVAGYQHARNEDAVMQMDVLSEEIAKWKKVAEAGGFKNAGNFAKWLLGK